MKFHIFLGVLCCALMAGATEFADGMGLFNRRLGMFVHWGIYSVNGFHEQERMRKGLGRAEYEKCVAGFTAEKFDADELVKVAESAGAEYIVFTTKHHDGFCMWDTKTTDFKITNSPAKRDVLKELAEACRRRGMKLGFYYSNPDWHHPSAYNPQSTHQVPPEPGDQPDMEKYRAFVKAQIRELMTNYGEVCCLFWDIPTHISKPEMNALVRSLQPGILINNRGWGKEFDYSTPERSELEEAEFTRYTEACDSVGAQSWGYRIGEDYRTIGYLTRAIDRTLSKGGNYLLNVGPKADGTVPDEAKEIMAKVGRWFAKTRESYRNVVANPYLIEDRVVTDNGNAFYVHFNDGLFSRGIALPPCAIRPKRVTLLNTGAELDWKVEFMPKSFGGVETPRADCLHILNIPADELANECVVLKVER